MSLPVERSITVSAPQRGAQRSFSTSSSIELLTAELPMLALILTAKPRPMAIGSSSGGLMLGGVIRGGGGHPPPPDLAGRRSLSATNAISGVISPRRAYASWVTGLRPRRTEGRKDGKLAVEGEGEA